MAEDLERLKEKVLREPTSRLFVPVAEELRKAGRLQEALQGLKAGLSAQPNYASARVALGKLYLQMGQKAEALKEFEEVVRAVPDNLYAQRKLAELYLQEGRQEAARQALRAVLRLNPMDEEAQQMLSELQSQQAPSMEEVLEPTSFAQEGPEAREAEAEVLEEAEGEVLEATAEDALEVEEAPVAEEPSFEPQAEASRVGSPEAEAAPSGEAPKEGLSEAEALIGKDELPEAYMMLKRLLSREPSNSLLRQRLEELKMLLRLTAQEPLVKARRLEAFLQGIKARRDEFHRGA